MITSLIKYDTIPNHKITTQLSPLISKPILKMTKNYKRNTKNSNKNVNTNNKKQKTVPNSDSQPLNPAEEVVETPLNDKNPSNDNDFLKIIPTENLSENQQGKLPENPTPPPKPTSPNEFKTPSWDALVVEEMNVDDDDDNISVASDFLVNPAATTSSTAANSTKNGPADTNKATNDTADDAEPIAKNDDEDDFIRIFKPTKFIGSISMDAVKGNKPSDKFQLV